MWITLATTDILRSLTEAEADVVQAAATSPDQDDPLASVLTDVVREVRGYVAGNAANSLGTGVTIPDELRGAALARARFESLTRLPIGRSILTEDRVSANEAATRLLRDVAGGRFAIVQPETVTTDTVGAPSPSVRERTRTFDRASQDGL